MQSAYYDSFVDRYEVRASTSKVLIAVFPVHNNDSDEAEAFASQYVDFLNSP